MAVAAWRCPPSEPPPPPAMGQRQRLAVSLRMPASSRLQRPTVFGAGHWRSNLRRLKKRHDKVAATSSNIGWNCLPGSVYLTVSRSSSKVSFDKHRAVQSYCPSAVRLSSRPTSGLPRSKPGYQTSNKAPEPRVRNFNTCLPTNPGTLTSANSPRLILRSHRLRGYTTCVVIRTRTNTVMPAACCR